MIVDSLSHLPLAKQQPIREKIQEANEHFREMMKRWQAGEPFAHIENLWAAARRDVDRMLQEVRQ